MAGKAGTKKAGRSRAVGKRRASISKKGTESPKRAVAAKKKVKRVIAKRTKGRGMSAPMSPVRVSAAARSGGGRGDRADGGSVGPMREIEVLLRNTGRQRARAGLAVWVGVAEGSASGLDTAIVVNDHIVTRNIEQGDAKKGGAVGGMAATQRAARAIGTKARMQRLAATVSALGHAARVAILVKLLEGPATYRTLKRAAGMNAGPMYHHLDQLRLASLILPKKRDLYGLTRGGRNVILAALAMMSLAADSRERPV